MALTLISTRNGHRVYKDSGDMGLFVFRSDTSEIFFNLTPEQALNLTANPPRLIGYHIPDWCPCCDGTSRCYYCQPANRDLRQPTPTGAPCASDFMGYIIPPGRRAMPGSPGSITAEIEAVLAHGNPVTRRAPMRYFVEAEHYGHLLLEIPEISRYVVWQCDTGEERHFTDRSRASVYLQSLPELPYADRWSSPCSLCIGTGEHCPLR